MEQTKTVYFAIQNNGEIDVNAFRLIGASTKRGDNTKIGHFGSGLKYAIAVLLRNKINFRVFTGTKEIKISTSKQSLRGQDFEVIKFNGRLTSLTTEMGEDWKLWFAMREIYCNALDEGKITSGLVEGIDPKPGTTTFYVELDNGINEIFELWNDYFSEKRMDLIYQDDIGNKYFGGLDDRLIIYRKGVQVLERKNTSCLFHYDFHDIEINESRTIVSEFEMEYSIVSNLKYYATHKMIAQIFDNINSFEAKIDWGYAGDFSEKWLEVLAGRIIILEDTSGNFLNEQQFKSNIVLPNRLAMALKKTFGVRVKILGVSDKYGERKVRDLQGREIAIVQECMSFLVGEIDVLKYPVRICEFEDHRRHGEAFDGEILLSTKVFDVGKRWVVSTILEEYWHLETSLSDETRAFQDFLINRYIESIENKKQMYL